MILQTRPTAGFIFIVYVLNVAIVDIVIVLSVSDLYLYKLVPPMIPFLITR